MDLWFRLEFDWMESSIFAKSLPRGDACTLVLFLASLKGELFLLFYLMIRKDQRNESILTELFILMKSFQLF